MSNKKEKHDKLDTMLTNMADMIEQMDEKQLAMLQSIISGEMDFDEQTNMIFYHYERPDYSRQTKPYGNWLLPFKDVEPEEARLPLFERVEAAGNGLSLEEKRQDIRSFLYELFQPFDPNVRIQKETGCWQLYGPLWLLERLRLTDCLDIVLEALRQEAHFFTAQIDGMGDWFSAVLYQLGHNQLDVLESFIRENGIVPRAKPICFDAIVLAMLHQPQKRLKALSILSNYLNYIHKICLQGADTYNIEHYAISLCSAHAKELLPLIRLLYADLEVPTVEIAGGISELEEMMNDDSLPFICEYSSLDAAIREPEDEDDEDFWENDYLDDEYDLPNVEEIYDKSVHQKCYTVSIELLDAPIPVVRTLHVPSNIYLSAFVELLTIAFGWKKPAEKYVFDDGISFYTQTDSINNDLFGQFLDVKQHVLAELLKKRGDTLRFDIHLSQGNIWKNTIRLEKSGRYKAGTEHLIVLGKAQGIYPCKSIPNMEDYARRLETGTLRETNMMKVRKALHDFDVNHTQPF